MSCPYSKQSPVLSQSSPALFLEVPESACKPPSSLQTMLVSAGHHKQCFCWHFSKDCIRLLTECGKFDNETNSNGKTNTPKSKCETFLGKEELQSDASCVSVYELSSELFRFAQKLFHVSLPGGRTQSGNSIIAIMSLLRCWLPSVVSCFKCYA